MRACGTRPAATSAFKRAMKSRYAFGTIIMSMPALIAMLDRLAVVAGRHPVDRLPSR